MAHRLRAEFDSEVPKSVNKLCSLSGVGSKMAFLCLHATLICVCSHVFDPPRPCPRRADPSMASLKLKDHDGQLNSDPESGLGQLPFVSSAPLRARQGQMLSHVRGNKESPGPAAKQDNHHCERCLQNPCRRQRNPKQSSRVSKILILHQGSGGKTPTPSKRCVELGSKTVCLDVDSDSFLVIVAYLVEAALNTV